MPDQAIKGSVGEAGANAPSDVVLVQAMLVTMQRAPSPGQPAGRFLDSYDGDCGNKTKAAIRDFQSLHVFVNAAGNQCAPNPLATAGLVRPNDATWKKLISMLSADFADLRVLPGGKIVYVAASVNELQSREAQAQAMTFNPIFAAKLRACLKQMHDSHGIALGVCPKGDRRNFQTQYELYLQGPSITNAGPGESNHNYGMAADIGFAGLRWLHSDGSVDGNETPWLHHLNAYKAAEALKFWEAMRAVGTSAPVGLFRGPLSDRPHLQNWDDSEVTMGKRLAALLQASGGMKWSYAYPNYSSDLGLGGAQVPLGKAADIWNLNASLTLAQLSQARTAAAATQGAPAPAAATPADLEAMKQLLRQQFETADANWKNWTPY